MRLIALLVLAGCHLGSAPPPVISSIEPAIGSVGGGTRVTIEGSGLEGASIEIGGVACTEVKTDSSERISCLTGSRDFVEGTGDVVVSTDGGTATLPAAYTYRCLWTTSMGRVSCGAAPPTPVAEQPISEWITKFDVDHGFVADTGAAELNDTADFALGSQAAWIETSGTGASITLSRSGMGPIDMTGQQIKVWVKVDRIDAADQIELRLGSGGSYFAFHLQSGQGQQWMTDGDWVAYTVSWSPENYTVVGSPNRAAITDIAFRVADDRTARVRFHVNGLALVPEPVDRFPEGALSFTFDDGWDTMMLGAADLARHEFPGTAYVIIDYVGANDHVTLTNLEELHAAGWDIAAHAFTGQHHDARFPWLSGTVVEDDMVDTRAWLIEHKFRGYDHCAFPGGDFDLSGRDILPIASKYFASCRTIYQKQREASPPADPLKLRVLYVTNAVALPTVELAVDRAIANREWIILVFHQLVDAPASTTQWRASDFTALVDYVAQSGIAVVPVSGVLAE